MDHVSLAFGWILRVVSFWPQILVTVAISVPISLLLIHVLFTTSALKEWEEWRALWSRQYSLRKLEAAVGLSRTHTMSVRDFESYVALLFRESGFRVESRGGPRDQGCDLLLSNNYEVVVCQVKRSSRPVTNKAVQEAVAAVSFYNANRAMVVTNATFTKGAFELALANRCELIGHQELQHKVAASSASIKSKCRQLRDQWAQRIAARLANDGKLEIPVARGEDANQRAREMKSIVTEYLRTKDRRFADSVRVYVAPGKRVGLIKRPIILFKVPARG
jgi:HJR/Mrr/RecB family endonuclease